MNNVINFADWLGPEPKWLTCDCGQQCSRVPCWSCSNHAAKIADEVIEAARARSACGIPKRYQWARLEGSEIAARVQTTDRIDKIARRVLAAQRVVFAGPSGAGKTSLACACLREASLRGSFVSAIALGSARIQYAAGHGEAPLVARAMTAPLVLIDEVGGEGKTATNAVRDVIFARYDADLPTWITTGFSYPELVSLYGDGITRRLTEGVTVVKLGPSGGER